MKLHGNHTWLESKLYDNGHGVGTQVAHVVSFVAFLIAWIGEWTILLQIILFFLCLWARFKHGQNAPRKLDGYLVINRNLNGAIYNIANNPERNTHERKFMLIKKHEWDEIYDIIQIHEEYVNKLKAIDSSHTSQQNTESIRQVEQLHTTRIANRMNTLERDIVLPVCVSQSEISRLTVRTEVRVWHFSIRGHYEATAVSVVSIVLMILTKYNNDHAYKTWSLIINIIATLNMCVIIRGSYVIYSSMVDQIIVFYRLLAWEKLCEKGYRVLEIVPDPPRNTTKYDIRPVKSIISSSNSTDHYLELTAEGKRIEFRQCEGRASLSLRRVEFAKQLHTQSLKEQIRVADVLNSTSHWLFAVIAVLLVLMVLPDGYDTTVDVLYATTLAVQATTLVTAAGAFAGWSNAALVYTEACWMLELANSKLQTNDAKNYINLITSHSCNAIDKKWYELLRETTFIDHKQTADELDIC